MTKEHFPYVAIVSVVAVVAVVILLLSLRTTTQAPAEQLAEEGAVEALAGEAIVIPTPNAIRKGQYFMVYDAGYDNSLRPFNGQHLYKYVSADAPSTENAKIRLEEVATGDLLELNYVYQDYAGGIKGGAYLRVGLFQDYAGGNDESKDYYIILNVPPTSRQRDALAFISTDPEIGAGKIQFKKTGTVRLQ